MTVTSGGTRKPKKSRRFHSIRGVSNMHYRFHCHICDRYFTREPKAATCKGRN